MLKRHVRKKLKVNILDNKLRTNDENTGVKVGFIWLHPCRNFPPDAILRYPKPPKIVLPTDELITRNRLKYEHILEEHDEEETDATKSLDYQFATAQYEFMKKGMKKEKAYYLAKLVMRNKQALALRKQHLNVKKDIDPNNSVSSENIFDVWLDRLMKETIKSKNKTPPKKVLEKIVKEYNQ